MCFRNRRNFEELWIELCDDFACEWFAEEDFVTSSKACEHFDLEFARAAELDFTLRDA